MNRRTFLTLAAAVPGLWLTGCGKAPQMEFDSAEEAIEALNTAENIEIYADLYSKKKKTEIVADGKVAGYLQGDTVYIDGEEWFSIDYVTDEPINNVEGVKTGSTYGYYDMDDNCLGYGQERVIAPDGGEEAWYIQFLDADGNPKEDYYATEEGTMLLDSEGNVIARVNGSIDLIGTGCTINFVMEDGVDQEVDIKDKIVMTMPKFDELKRYYLDNYM